MRRGAGSLPNHGTPQRAFPTARKGRCGVDWFGFLAQYGRVVNSPGFSRGHGQMTDYLRHTHHEFLAASEAALADPRLQQILGQLGDTLGRRNKEAWAALPNSDLI